jgi:hypothetical protein
MLLALQLIANRDCVWLLRRWEAVDLGATSKHDFSRG